MLTNLNDPALAVDAKDLLRRAERVPGSGKMEVEFNFPAGILQCAGLLNGQFMVERYAELTMLQLALINEGMTPSSAWLYKAYEAGWRYRLDKGFHKDGPTFSLEAPPQPTEDRCHFCGISEGFHATAERRGDVAHPFVPKQGKP